MTDQPPAFKANGDYELWRISLQQWRMSTEVEPRRQALVARTKLNGRAREIALSLDAANLNSDFGMDVLLEHLDEEYRKDKWRREKEEENQRLQARDKRENEHMQKEQQKFESELTPRERARLRAAKVTAKLGKDGVPPTAPMPPAVHMPVMNPADQIRSDINHVNTFSDQLKTFDSAQFTTPMVMPEVKKKDLVSGYYADVEINDMAARPFLIKKATHDLITSKTGCGVSLRGRYIPPEGRSTVAMNDRSLTLHIEADISAKVQVAVHKIIEVNRNYEKNPDNSYNNYGLTGNQSHGASNKHQDRLFVGFETHPAFRLKEKITGHRGANFRFIEEQTGAKLSLRGKGSGHIDHNSKRESFEAMHIHISHPRQDGLVTAKQLCSNLVDTVRNEHQSWMNGGQMNQQQQQNTYRPSHSNGNMAYNSAPPPVHVYQNPAVTFPAVVGQSPRFNQPMGNSTSSGYLAPGSGPFPNAVYQASNYGSPYGQRSTDGDKYHYNRSRSPSDRRRSRSRSPSERRRSRSRSPSDRRRNRSRSPKDRRRSRSRSPPSDRRRNRSRSPSNRRSRSPQYSSESRSSNNVSPGRKETKRRFTEEPKKRRKFSEDPKLLEQRKKESDIIQSIMKPSALPESISSPPSSNKGFASPNNLPIPASIKKGLKLEKSDDIFSTQSKSKILKMGALGSIAAYDEDSDDSG